MKLLPAFLATLTLVGPIACQQIQDVLQTTWNRGKLLGNANPSSPINFGTPGAVGSADIVVNDAKTYQSIWGFGATLTDSSAALFADLKSKNSGNYNDLLNKMFSIKDGQTTAGLSYIRVTVASSDFSTRSYELTDSSVDDDLSTFNFDKIPVAMFQTMLDIQAVNPSVKFHVLPWSPPGWMKDSNRINGGNFLSSYQDLYAQYLLKVLQGFKSKGINVYALSVQNEPANSSDSYPTAKFKHTQEAAVARALKSLLNSNGLGGIKLIGMDHNFSMVSSYAIPLMQEAGDVFAGVAFHCYMGKWTDIAAFHNAFPDKEIYETECTGGIGSDWWSDIKWYMDNLMIGTIEQSSHTALMWNLALNGSGGPKLPGTSSCQNPECRGVVQINNDGTYSLNQEYYAMAQASRAILPRDVGGPWGKRIGVTSSSGLLRVSAFVTQRTSSADWNRYSLVVLNWNDGGSSGWNPQDVTTTIEFRGAQAKYTFPVGVTTLWWYAAA